MEVECQDVWPGPRQLGQQRVGGGENGGRTLTEANVVRSIVPAGTWDGEAVSLHAPPPAGERTALLLQADDGQVLAAALLPSS